MWLIDPNPQDIGMIDFYRPDGTPVAVVRGDPRQLNDATFHAGTRSGSAYEYVDTFNKLHFYVLATRRSADGVLNYDVAVRRTGEGDPFTRGIALGNPTKKGQRPGFLATCTFPLTNTGQAGAAPFDSDVYRVSATSSSPDWKVTLPNALAAAKAGATVQVPVHVLRDPLTDDGRRADDGDAHRQVRGRLVEDGDADVRGARARHDAGELDPSQAGAGPRASPRPPLLCRTMRRLAPLAALLVLASCGGGDEDGRRRRPTFPEPFPPGRVRGAAASAVTAPDFTAELIDGTPVTASDLWRDRPVVLVFTASYCDRCAEIHRAAAEAVDAHDGAIGLLGVVGEDDVDGGRDYADELDLGHPVAVAGERTWLDYAAREPGLVVLVAKGGKVLRGWPGGATAEQLQAASRSSSPGEARRAPACSRCCSRAARPAAGTRPRRGSGSSFPDNNIREEGVECAGARPFRQIHRGTSFTVEDEDGEVVAEGELPAGRAENADPSIDWGVDRIPTVCVMEVELDLPDRPRYRFVLPDTVPLDFDAALLARDEPVELILSG